MKIDEFVISYGTSGAELFCPNPKCKPIELPYPLITVGGLTKIVKKHIKQSHK